MITIKNFKEIDSGGGLFRLIPSSEGYVFLDFGCITAMSHKQLVEEIAEDIKTMPLTELKEMVGLLTNFHETYLENKAIQDRDTERNATFKMSSAKQAEQHLLQGIRIEEL